METLNKKEMRILITRTDRIGDLVLSTPVFSAIKKQFPDAFLAAMCLPGTREVLEGNSNIDEVIVYDKRGSEKYFWQSLRFGLQLKKKRFDVAIHLHPTNRVHILSFIAKIPTRIGYDRNFGFLLTQRITEEKSRGEKHEAEYNFDLLHSLGVSVPDQMQLAFPLDEADLEHFEETIRKEGVRLKDFSFVMNASASCPSKRWPPARFAALADSLIEKYSLQAIIISDAVNQDIAGEVLSRMRQEAINLTGKLNLKDLGALFSRVKFLVSNDTGPVHIAAALGLPVVSIFGRFDPGLSPQRWRPLGPKSFYIHNPPECVPCLAHNCQIDFECLTNIQVKDVSELLEREILPHVVKN